MKKLTIITILLLIGGVGFSQVTTCDTVPVILLVSDHDVELSANPELILRIHGYEVVKKVASCGECPPDITHMAYLNTDKIRLSSKFKVWYSEESYNYEDYRWVEIKVRESLESWSCVDGYDDLVIVVSDLVSKLLDDQKYKLTHKKP